MRFSLLAALATTLGAFVFTGFATAADKPARDRNAATARDNAGQDAKIDKKTGGGAARVSEIRGMTVRNSQNKDLGDIKDVMLDMGEHGRARYAALSFGGFLGMGDKLFAIPWNALQFRHDADHNKNFVLFDVTEEKLKQTPGFDKDHWPDMADRRWMQDVDKHHGVDVRAGNTEVKVRTTDRDADRKSEHADKDRHFRLHRASEAAGMTVRNDNGDKLGKVEDFVVDLHSGDIRYAALSFGGFLGIGDKLFAVPFDAVRLAYDSDHDDYYIAFNVTKDQLDQAAGFDKDHWPDFGNEKWAASNDAHYTAHRNRRETRTGEGTRVK
ncbi:MAG TPA: PRC-barrel domain-containing protein [Pirellulales bacterium]|nr:PRC-barrel domain-containing protein [Pirellulales bacterium]